MSLASAGSTVTPMRTNVEVRGMTLTWAGKTLIPLGTTLTAVGMTVTALSMPVNPPRMTVDAPRNLFRMLLKLLSVKDMPVRHF